MLKHYNPPVLYAAKNTIAVAAHIALEETGLEHEIYWVDFATGGQHDPHFRLMNPKGRVPVFDAGDCIITETPAILEYIAEVSGQLMPEGINQRAEVREMMAYCASTFHVNHAHKLRGARWSDDPAAHASMAAKVPQTMAECCAYIDSNFDADDEWVAFTYSIADAHLFAICRWLEGDGVDITKYPSLAAHFDRMHARPAVQRALAHHG